MRKYILIILSFLLFLPNLFHVDIAPIPSYNNIERFNPGLSSLNIINKLEKYIDSIAIARSISIGDKLSYVEIIDSVVKERFYHGFSHFTLNENWMVVFADKYIYA